jgi:uncharacterized protein
MNDLPAPSPVVSTYFIPGLRISTLLSPLAAGSESAKELSPDVLGDVVQAEVTRVCNGASQYSFTLNNYKPGTIYAPVSNALGIANALNPTSLSAGPEPSWPPYKYNDFSIIAFGQRLRIDMQDWRDPSTARKLLQTATYENSWVPMVSGPVTDMRFEFSSGSGARVTISGEDDLSQLKDHIDKRHEFPKVPERQIVREVLKFAKYPLSLSDPQIAWPPFADDAGQGITESMADGQSYLDFLQKLADHLDCEVFIEYSDLTKATSPQEFHFEVSRCRQPPVKSTGDIFVLHRDVNLIEFSPSIRVVDQPTRAQVKGRHRDRNNPTMVVGDADPSVDQTLLMDELHPDDSTTTPQKLTAGPLVRSHFFKNRNDNPSTEANKSNMDQERAKILAQAQLRKKAREFFTIEGTTLGLPRLRPGNFIQIKRMRPPFDGFYYVTKTVHSYGADGARTKFTARRPGMVLPPYQEN